MRCCRSRILAKARRAAELEQQPALAAEGLLHVRIAGSVGEFLGDCDRIGAVALGRELRLARIKLSETFGDNRQICAGHRLVEANQNVPAFTRSPSWARTSPTTPPVGCCTFFTLIDDQ